MKKATNSLFYKLMNTFAQEAGYKGYSALEKKSPKKFSVVKKRAKKVYEKMTGKKLKLNPTNIKKSSRDFAVAYERFLKKYVAYLAKHFDGQSTGHAAVWPIEFRSNLQIIQDQRFEKKDGNDNLIGFTSYRKDIYTYLFHVARLQAFCMIYHDIAIEHFARSTVIPREHKLSAEEFDKLFFVIENGPSKMAHGFESSAVQVDRKFEGIAADLEPLLVELYNIFQKYAAYFKYPASMLIPEIISTRYGQSNIVTRLKDKIDHAIGMDELYGPKWKNFRFGGMSPLLTSQFLDKLETDFTADVLKAEASGLPSYLPASKFDWDETVITYNDKEFLWEKLSTGTSSKEGIVGKHCGNSPRAGQGDILYSLRQKKKGKELYNFIMTVTIDAAGQVREAKGKANTHPKPQHYKYYVDLIVWHHQQVAPITYTAGDIGWQTRDNIHFRELPIELKQKLVQFIPSGIEKFDYISMHMPEALTQEAGQYVWNGSDTRQVSKDIKTGNKLWVEFLLKNKIYFKVKLADAVSAYGLNDALKIWMNELSQNPLSLIQMFSDIKDITKDSIRIFDTNIKVDKKFLANFAWALKPTDMAKILNSVAGIFPTPIKGAKFFINAIIEAKQRSIDFDTSPNARQFQYAFDYGYQFNKKGDIVRINQRTFGMSSKNAKRIAREAALDDIRQFLDELEPTADTMKKILEMAPDLNIPKYIIRAYPLQVAIDKILDAFSKKKVSDDLKEFKKNLAIIDGQYMYKIISVDDIADVADELGHNLDDYSTVLRDGHVDLYYDSSLSQNEIEGYLLTAESQLKKSKYQKKATYLHRISELMNVVVKKHSEEDELSEDEKELYDKTVSAIQRADLYAKEAAAYDDIYSQVKSYIEEFGHLEFSDKVNLYIRNNNLMRLLKEYYSDSDPYYDLDDFIEREWKDFIDVDSSKFVYQEHFGFNEEVFLEQFIEEIP